MNIIEMISSTDNFPRKVRKRWFWRWVKILSSSTVVFGLLVLWLGPPLYERWILRYLSADQIAEYHRWRTKIVEFPPAVLNAATYSESLKQAARDFESAWDEHAQAPAREPLLKAFYELIELPDYSVRGTESHRLERWPMTEFESIWELRDTFDLAVSDAVQVAQSGEAVNALHHFIKLSRVSRTPEFENTSYSMIGFLFASRVHEGLRKSIATARDPAALRMLLEQREIFTGSIPSVPENVDQVTLDRLGDLAELRRRGMRWEPGKLRGSAFQRYVRALRDEYNEKYLLPQLPPDSPEASQIRSLRELRTVEDPWYADLPFFPRWREAHDASSYFAIAMLDTEALQVARRLLLTQYDLLFLEAAIKLYSIEQGHRPESLHDLVPDYLEELPSSRWGEQSEPYRYREGSDPQVYAIGPDGVDDRMSKKYTRQSSLPVPKGDIWLGMDASPQGATPVPSPSRGQGSPP